MELEEQIEALKQAVEDLKAKNTKLTERIVELDPGFATRNEMDEDENV